MLRARALGLARRHHDARLAHRRRARAALRRRLRVRDRRRRAGRDRPRRPRARRRRRGAHPPRPRRRGAADQRVPRRDRAPRLSGLHRRRLVGADPVAGTLVVARHRRDRERHVLRRSSRASPAGSTTSRRCPSCAAAKRPAPPLLVGPGRTGDAERARRRVQSPPRGRPHAVRRRTHGRVGHVARGARPRCRARRAPERPQPYRRRRRGRRGARHQPPRHRHHRGAHRRRHGSRHRVHRRRPARHRRPQRPRRPSPTRSPISASRPPDRVRIDELRPALPQRHRHDRRADRDRQDDRGLHPVAALGADVRLVPAQGHRQDAEPHRPRPRRALRPAPDPRRRHQAVLQGAVVTRRPPTSPVFRLAPVPRDHPRVPRVRDRAHRRARHRRRPPHLPPARSTRRSACCGCS